MKIAKVSAVNIINEITNEIYKIYTEKSFENNKEDLIKYIDFIKDYFINKYENNCYYDFTNIKPSSEYNSLNEFYKDLLEEIGK